MIRAEQVDPESRILYVDDGSKDKTWAIISEYAEAIPYVDGVKLAHNRGHQNRPARRPHDRHAAVRLRHQHGCRPAGFARRDSRTAPHDPRRRVRPGIRLEEEAPRPGRQTLAEQILQLDGAPGLRHQTPRFQLRAEGLPPQGRQVDRGLRRDAPFHSDSGEAGRVPPYRRKRSSSTTPANTAARSSASNVP